MDSERNTLWARRQYEPAEARCACGQLIAKIRGDNLDIKCKRCKRIVSISYDRLKETDITIAPCGQ